MKIRMFNWTRFPIIEERPELVVAYEDFETSGRVKEALDAVAQVFDPASGKNWLSRKCRTTMWKFDLLNYPELLRLAVRDAATAEIIIVSAHGDCELPPAVKSWIEEWLRIKTTRGGILIALLDAAVEGESHSAEIFDYLKAAAETAGFEWIATFADTDDLGRESLRQDNVTFEPLRRLARPHQP